MKKGMSIREKVLLCILAILAMIMVYYYAFYIPTQDEIAQYKEEYTLVDDSIILADAKAIKLSQMKAELEAIKGGETEVTKELPAYDNRQNLMVQLSNILAKSQNYNITFGAVSADGKTMTRSISLDYSCESYEAAKAILMEIYNGEYPCTFHNLYLTNGGSSISVDIIYFEYQK